MRRPDAPGPADAGRHDGRARPGAPTLRPRPRVLRGLGRRDRGSAIAEFAMVAGLVVLLGVGVFQLALVLYVRNALISDASEGARLGARAGASLDEGAARTRDLITRDVGGAYAQGVRVARQTTSAGVLVVEVTVSAPAPIIGLVGPGDRLTVTGRAFQEGQ